MEDNNHDMSAHSNQIIQIKIPMNIRFWVNASSNDYTNINYYSDAAILSRGHMFTEVCPAHPLNAFQCTNERWLRFSFMNCPDIPEKKENRDKKTKTWQKSDIRE
jgi:hypothetical protein